MSMRGVKKPGADDGDLRGARGLPRRRRLPRRGAAVHPPTQVHVALTPASVMGIVNVTPDSFFPGSRTAARDAGRSRADARSSTRAATSSTWAASRRAPARTPVRRGRGAGAGRAGGRARSRRAGRSRSTRRRPRWRAPRSRAGARGHQRRLGHAGRPRRRAGRAATSRCTARATPRRCRSTRATTTWSPRSRRVPRGAWRAGARGRRRATLARSGHRLRQDRRAQPHAAGAPASDLVERARDATTPGVLVGTSRKRFLARLGARDARRRRAPRGIDRHRGVGDAVRRRR